MLYYCWRATWIKNVKNFQIAKVYLRVFLNICLFFANISLALLIKVSPIKKACSCRVFLDILLLKSSRSQMIFKIGLFKYWANFTAKDLCWSLFLIKLQAFRTATILKRDSNTVVFLWNLRNVFYRTPPVAVSVYYDLFDNVICKQKLRSVVQKQI